MAGIYGCFKGRNSDSAAMASGPLDATANQETAEVVEECSGKKKSKFQTFKKFFARKKRKEASVSGVEGGLKASQSSDNVNNEPENSTLTRSEKDNGSGSKVSLGSKALSHDSIFVSDSSEAHEALGASQDSIPGKVKSLQMQLKQAIRLGSPPSLMCVKKTEDPSSMSEDDGLPCSPPEYSTLHTVLNQVQTNSSLSLEGTDSDEDQLSCAASSRAVSPLVVVPGDFSQPASPNVCLDNSGAKHKLGLRHKAHAKRKPASRVELRIEGDSLMDETLSTSIAESVEEREEQERGDLSGEQLRTTEGEERDEESEEEERERPQHSARSPLRDAEGEEGEEDEAGAGPDVSHAPDASSALLSDSEQRLPEEEEAPDGRLPASASTRASRLTPEPDTSLTQRGGAGERGDFPLGLAEGEDDDDDDDGVLGNIGGMESGEEEESSFLQEVLSSLKTPLTSCSLGGREADSIVLRVDEEQGLLTPDEERQESEEEEGSEDALEVLEAVQDGEVEMDDEGMEENQVDREEQEALSPSPTQEQEGLVLDETTPSCPAVGEEEEEEDGTREKEEEEEKALVGQFRGQDEEEEDEEEKQEAQEVTPGHNDTGEEEDEPLTMGSNRAESDEEKEVTDPEKESEEEEGERKEEEEEEEEHQRQEEEEAAEVAAWEERDGKESMEEDVGVEDDEGEEEEEREEQMTVPDQTTVGTPTGALVADESLDDDGVQEEDAAAATEHMDQTPIHPEPCDQPFSPTDPEYQADERADQQEGDYEGVEVEREMERKPYVDTNRPDVESTDSDQAGVEAGPQDVDRASVGMSRPDVNTPEGDRSEPEQLAVEPAATEQAAVSSQPPSGSFPESHGYSTEAEPQEESETCAPSTPGSDTSIAAIVGTDSVSPSSQQAVTPAQQSTGAVALGEINDAATEQDTVKQSSSGASVEEDAAGPCDKEAGKQSPTEAETTEEAPQPSSPPTTADKMYKQPSVGSDQSKVRFTIAPAWQRSLSTGGGSPDEPVVPPSPSSPTPCPSAGSSSPPQSNPLAKAEPVSSTKVEVVLSPTSRMRNVTAIPVKTQSNVTAAPAKPQTSAVAATEESPVQGESPFGVRLRRTVVLHRFSSEEENTEPAVEPPAQPAMNKAAPLHPVSAKPSLSQPVAIKPALLRKPDVQGEKPKSTPADVTSARGVPSGSDPPSWISVARQKQRIYKDGSLDETTLRKEEPERKSSLPLYVGSAASRDHLKTPELTSKGSSFETTKPTTPVEKEGRRAFSPPTPVPPQPAKPQSHPAPIAAPKPLSQPTPSQRALPAPTPVPVSQRVSPYVSPPSVAKTSPSTKTPQPQTSTHPRPLGQPSSTLTCPPFSNRSTMAQSGTIQPRAPGLSSPTQPSPRGPLSPSSPSPSLPQDEPPWMALAKKKAKAWSEMPQIVQ